MLNINKLKRLEGYDMFFFTDHEGNAVFKGIERMGGFAECMYNTGKQYMHAYSRADEHNMQNLRGALAHGSRLQELLSLAWTELPATYAHCVTALVLLGYSPATILGLFKGDMN